MTVLLGLVECEGRRTLRGLLQAVWDEVSLSGFSRFLCRWPWSPLDLVHTWQADFCATTQELVWAEHARQQAMRPKRTGRSRETVVTGYLILDDLVHTKPKGERMC